MRGKLGPFSLHLGRDGLPVDPSGWVRVGHVFFYYRVNPPVDPAWTYFSERYGRRKYIRLGRLVLGIGYDNKEAPR